MKMYAANGISIAQFSLSASNSVDVIKEILFKSELNAEEINGLKNIFFRNLGFIQLGVLKDISAKIRKYLELSAAEDSDYIEECGIDIGKLFTANIFLKSIISFRNTIITTETIEEVRKNWAQQFGAHA